MIIDIIDEMTCETLAKMMDALYELEDGSDLTLNISSYGGELLPTIGIIDVLRAKHLNVTCNIIGFACSAAAILALSCQKVCISPLGSLMIHSAWSEMAEANDPGIARCNAVQLDIIRERCKDFDEKMLKKDHWFNAQQCLELGLCDELYNSAAYEALAVKYAAKLKSQKEKIMNEEVKVDEVIEQVKEDEEMAEEMPAQPEENHDVIELIEKLVERVDTLESRLQALEQPVEEQVEEQVEAECGSDEQERINNLFKAIVTPQACAPIACGKPAKPAVLKVPKGFDKYFKD